MYEQALDQFYKLNSMQSNPQALCKIAEINEKKGEYDQAENWYLQALKSNPKDSELLKSIANIYEKQGERAQAFQYYHDVTLNFVFLFFVESFLSKNHHFIISSHHRIVMSFRPLRRL
jgi:tetratricopeptide (TPR) repeat protein